MILQQMCNPIGNQNLRKKAKQNIRTARTPQSVVYLYSAACNHLTSASCMQSTELLGVFILCPQMDASRRLMWDYSGVKIRGFQSVLYADLAFAFAFSMYLPFPNFKSAFPYAHNSKRDPNWNMMAKSTFFLPNQP